MPYTYTSDVRETRYLAGALKVEVEKSSSLYKTSPAKSLLKIAET
jgi:hypothetical protein